MYLLNNSYCKHKREAPLSRIVAIICLFFWSYPLVYLTIISFHLQCTYLLFLFLYDLSINFFQSFDVIVRYIFFLYSFKVLIYYSFVLSMYPSYPLMFDVTIIPLSLQYRYSLFFCLSLYPFFIWFFDLSIIFFLTFLRCIQTFEPLSNTPCSVYICWHR